MLIGSSSQLWMRLSGALQKKRNSELSYREMVKNSSNDETIAAKQVNGVVLQAGTGLPGVTGVPLLVSPWQGGWGEHSSCIAGLGSPFTHRCVPGHFGSLLGYL